MNKILVLKGPMASGKTSFAREYIKKHDHWVIVNRDSIRDGLGEYWVPERENLVSEIEYNSIQSAIESGWNVIIDATNCNPKTIAKWEALADNLECEIEYKEFWIPFEEALKHDQNPDRKHPVGYKVIYDFYKRYKPELLNDAVWDYRYIKPLDYTKERAIICDIDGTVALRRGRSPYDYEKCDTDDWNTPLGDLLFSLYMRKYNIIFVSGRENIGNAENKTRAWLDSNFGGLYQLFMREEGDHRPDEIVKEDIYHKYIEPDYCVVAVYDDRDKVVKMWREKLGLLTCQVYYGNF